MVLGRLRFFGSKLSLENLSETREGVLLEAWYELVIKTSQGNTSESKVTHDSQLAPPKIGDTWPLEE